MKHRVGKTLKGVGRLVLPLALSIVVGTTPALAGFGVVPKKSIVTVTIKSESEGISIQDRYYSHTKIHEVTELTGLVGAEGYVLAFAGSDLSMKLGSRDFKFSVRTFDGKGFPASLAGVDERLSMIYLRTPLPGDLAITFSSEPIQDNFKLAALYEGEWKIAEPCPRERKTLSFLPAVQLKLAELDLKTPWAGAAVIDLKGRLLGLVAGAWPQPTSSIVVSEIIPADLLRASFDTVRKTGENIRVGWVGVYLDDTDKRTLVRNVIADTPAAKAGLRSDDVIVEVDGEAVGELLEFGRAVRSRSPGAQIQLTVERQGRRQVVPLVLGARPKIEEKTAWKVDVPRTMGGDSKGGGIKFYRSQLPPLVDQGLMVDSIPPQLARKLRSPIKGGLLVKEVSDGSAGQKAGFLAGDVIFRINGKDVLNLTEVQEILETAPRGFVELQLVRDGIVKSLKIALQ